MNITPTTQLALNVTSGDTMTRMSTPVATPRHRMMRVLAPALMLSLCAAAPAAAQRRAAAASGSPASSMHDAPLDAVNALVQQRTKAKGAMSPVGARSKTKSASAPARKPSDEAAAVAPPKGWAAPPAAARPAAKGK